MNRLALLISLFFAVVSGLAQAGPQIERWQTPSGVEVLFVENHSLPIIDVQVDFAAGTAREPEGRAGVASLTRTLVDLGAGGMDETQIATRLADVGARLSGGVDMDRASISLRTLSMRDKCAPAFEILKAVLSQPHLPVVAFDREKARSVSALKEALTRPETLASKAFWAAMYPAHPYGRHATPESISALLHSDVLAFHAAFYSAKQASVAIVGDLTRGAAEALAADLTSGLPTGSPSPAIAPPSLPEAVEKRIDHPATQAHLLLGLPAAKRGDPDFFALATGNYSLGGGGFVSRLMKEVRDKRGLAYSVHSYFLPLQQPGPFQIGLQTKKGQADEALKLTREVLATFLEHGPSDAELRAAKQNLIGSFPLRLDTNRKILENVAMIGFYGLPLDYLDRYPENVGKVTSEEVRAAFARHVRPDHLVTVVVGGE
ncbi:pitrilysin family protein [Accumulibacter sp.]|uniref:M16 family metallopeptidase n=1 Tax=Accumulibacter sp. TaxID=2053492 RepID=UPI0025DF2D80|nr:pitrilysin family protein [Accumulibacter sp.]MCM8595305.1 insulinase family protein [Accumulibacter sp.]MCM8625240.1 insulinase family protein [Accumulibacter sp.]MDS4049452.1 pitrilysin family protein [Accumulibacter sp.]